MPKNPKSIVISFRLSPLIIAKAIDGLKNYDKSADITKLSSIIKQTTLHGINYLTHALPFEPTSESQRIVHHMTTQGRSAVSIEQSILGQPLQNLSILPADKPAEKYAYVNEEESKSVKSNVTDFSIPKDLMNELEDEEKEDEE